MGDQGDTSSVSRTPHVLPADQVLHKIEDELVGDIDDLVDRLIFAHDDHRILEHLEVLRAILRAQVRGYVGHLIARRAILAPHTSVMYAESVGAPGVVATTLRGLLDAGTLTTEQATRLMHFVADRRTLVIAGERRTGKSTLLNALFELVSVDERVVAIQHGCDLPALRDRSFCLQLSTDDAADLPALFAKARRMDANLVVLDDLRAGEVHEFFTVLSETPRSGGLCTVRADSPQVTLQMILDGLRGDAPEARRVVARVRPVILFMRRDHGELPRLHALWNVEADAAGPLKLHEIESSLPHDRGLLAEV